MSIATLDTAAAIAPRPEPKRDRFSRYLIPHPDTGKEMAWTRATTWAKSCADMYHVERWGLRMAVFGLTRRPDLLTHAATVADPNTKEAKKLLNEIAESAQEAGGSHARRNLGTAMHAFCEAVDRGETPNVPEAYLADVAAYQEALVAAGITIDQAHIERIVTVPDLNVAGTFDRLVTYRGRLHVADIKTGGTLEPDPDNGRVPTLAGMGEIAIQLALYANAATIYDPSTGKHEPMPEVDKERALVLHLPVGDARCRILEVDIAAGWEMAQVCGTVRRWRKRKDLAQDVTTVEPVAAPATVTPPAIPVPANRDEWIAGRITTLVASRAAKAMLADSWPAGMAKRGPWTDAEVAEIVGIIEPIEAAVEAPFPHLDPAAPTPGDRLAAERAVRDAEAEAHRLATATAPSWPVPDDGAAVYGAPVDDLRRRAAAVTPEQSARCSAWRAEGKRHGAPWGGTIDGQWSQRCYADNAAALACAIHLYDDDDPDALTRAAIAVVIGEDVQPSWTTGAVIGSLTIDQAQRLGSIANAFGANDLAVVTAIGERITAA